jgi:hypothetical protein
MYDPGCDVEDTGTCMCEPDVCEVEACRAGSSHGSQVDVGFEVTGVVVNISAVVCAATEVLSRTAEVDGVEPEEGGLCEVLEVWVCV